MDIYRAMLEEAGVDCSHWPDLDIHEQPASPLPWDEPTYALDYAQELHVRLNHIPKVPYKRLTHFKEHIMRLQGSERVTFPPWLLAKAATYTGDWKDWNMYRQVRTWMKTEKIPRVWYEHIFALARLMGGYSVKITENYIAHWLYHFPRWDRQYSSQNKNKNFPSYYVLLELLLKDVSLPYRLPSVSERKYSELYNKLRRLLL